MAIVIAAFAAPLNAMAQLLDMTPIPHPHPHAADTYNASNIAISVLVPNGTGWTGAIDLGSGSSTIQGIGPKLFVANCSASGTYSILFQATSYPFWIPMHDRNLIVTVLGHNKLTPVIPMNMQYTNATYGTVNLYGKC